jgi:hypothetical protein
MASMDSISTQLITQFNATMHIKQQQMSSRFRGYTENRPMVGDSMAYDGLGTVEARELTDRFAQVQFDDIEHFRRKVSRQRFGIALPFDEYDLEARLTNPSGDYARAATYAMERVYDRVVYASLFANVLYGRNFENTVTPTTDGVLTVTATAGLNLASMLQLKQNYIDSECATEAVDNGIGAFIAGEEHTTLMQIQQLTNSQYTNQMAIEKGRMIKVLGMDLVIFGNNVTLPLLPIVAGVRQCASMVRGGVCVGMVKEWEVTIENRPDLYQTRQLKIVGSLGATRTEGKLVQLLTTTV